MIFSDTRKEWVVSKNRWNRHVDRAQVILYSARETKALLQWRHHYRCCKTLKSFMWCSGIRSVCRSQCTKGDKAKPYKNKSLRQDRELFISVAEWSVRISLNGWHELRWILVQMIIYSLQGFRNPYSCRKKDLIANTQQNCKIVFMCWFAWRNVTSWPHEMLIWV